MKLFITILHKSSAVILLLAVMGTSFSKLVVQLDYHFNQKYIASTLCENRNRPACCCHGKCFLKKQLQKDDEGAKNAQSFSKDKFDVALFFEEQEKDYLIDATANKIFNSGYILKKYSASLSPVFHPPGGNC